MFTIIIFSKDRAAQLDLCLRSITKNLQPILPHCHDIRVVYTASNELYREGYTLLMAYAPPLVTWYPESGNFIDTFQTALNAESFRKFKRETTRHVLFFTDDDIVYRPMEKDCWGPIHEIMYEVLALSLRLGTNTFMQDIYQHTICTIPQSVINGKDILKRWNWKQQTPHCNFAVPFSLDGHIFNVDDVRSILSKIKEGYYNPNSMEGKVQHYSAHLNELKDTSDYMACFDQSYVVNTPINRVQETCTNLFGQEFPASQESLNEQFISGGRLDLESMDFENVIGCHQEVELKWG